MNTTTIAQHATSRAAVDAVNFALNKAMTHLLGGLNALDKKLRERPSSLNAQTAALLRLAEDYESTQPSYAADLRAAALSARQGESVTR